MKKLYILLFLAIGFIANAQIVNIPNANFKAKLLSATTSPANNVASTQTPIFDPINSIWSVSSNSTIDTNGDGEIQVTEAQAIKWLKLNGPTISDLTGIEAFTNLIYLECSNHQLTSLDVSGLINLKALDCSQNQIPSLDVSGLINLQTLYCNHNQLPSLDVSGLTNLQQFKCEYNQLPSLDVSGLTNLFYFECYQNQLTSLNVSGLTNLQNLICYSNQLTSLNVSGLTNLQVLTCYSNQLPSLDVSGLTNLQYLTCYNNQLPSLDVSGLINLKTLYCSNNQLLSLDVSGLINLQTLYCENNQISYLNIKKGNLNSWSNLVFFPNLNLQYICANEEDIDLVQFRINMNGSTNCHVNSYCYFTPGGDFYEITGNTKFDYNSDGCDVSDINYSNLIFSITDGVNNGRFIANETGDYLIPVRSGTHTIIPNLENPSYFTILPTSFVVDFPTQASPFTQDFCVTANGVKSDVEVMILSTTPARPGFDATYKIVYRNKGNQVENGSVSLTFDDAVLDYVSSNPVYNSSATNSFTWNYSNLQPFETREVAIVLNVNSPMESPAVHNGDVLNYIASIVTTNTDETPNDNTFTLNQTVVGSYDPNDKTCLEGVTITPSMVGKYVHYVIRFENTGTYPAQNIVVKDMIDLAKFDIATLVPLKGSHDFYTRIKDNKVEFIFENINLDFNDATNDGYVAFKIKTKSTLVIGNTFSNNSNIYFDYNFPITTNTYTTTIAALSTQNFEFASEFTLYPNPAKEVLNIQSKNSLEIQSIEVYNLLGQVVLAVPNAINAVDVSSLTTGNYFIKVNTSNGTSNTKFIKE